MTYARTDIAESDAIVRTGEPPTRRNTRRADVSVFMQTIDKMSDGEWFTVDNERTRRALQSRVIWHRLHGGLRAFSYIAANGDLVVVKGDGSIKDVSQELPRGTPVIRMGDPPKRKPTRDNEKPRFRCPYVCSAFRLAPGEWFKLPDTAAGKLRYSIHKYRTRDRVLMDVAVRQTHSMEWICIRRKP